jgi:VanZ family protein
MRRIFFPDSPYRKWARVMAVAWTLLIFILCLLPQKEIPEVNVPFIDKWTHLVLFGGFSFLWLAARPVRGLKWPITLFFIASAIGAIIEGLQGLLVSLGRSMELMDWYADTVGGFLGICLFGVIRHFVVKNSPTR